MDYSRRQFLNKGVAVAGSGTAYQISVLLGLTPSQAEATPRAELTALNGDPVSVVILGAGISGLVCAYELERAGYASGGMTEAPRYKTPLDFETLFQTSSGSPA